MIFKSCLFIISPFIDVVPESGWSLHIFLNYFQSNACVFGIHTIQVEVGTSKNILEKLYWT